MAMKRRHFLGVLGAASVAMGAAGQLKTKKKPTYVFFMIGDGMGTAQRKIAEFYAGLKNPGRPGELAMNQLPVYGFTTTTEVSGKITDSAAAGTALACGVKTINGVLGLGPDSTTPHRSMAFDAKESGKKVGIVTSVPIDHATPAAFYAQVKSRSMYYEIDEFLAESGLDYFAGEPMLGRAKAKGKTPPDQLAKAAGYRLIGDRAGFDALKSGDNKILIEHDLGYAINGPQPITLADYTRKGIELLNGEQGFFMMIEGGKIDWSGHANDLATNIHETLAFDEAVQVALDFCKEHPDESLLVVTADHETGGLQLNSSLPQTMETTIDAQKFESSHYTDQVEQWVKGGSVTPEIAFDRLTESFGFKNLPAQDETLLRELIAQTLSTPTKDARSAELKKMYGKKNMAVTGCLHELADHAGAEWTSFNHTDTQVQTTAYGLNADLFGGQTDNTDLGRQLKTLLKA
jgi:alkaline phosphatase